MSTENNEEEMSEEEKERVKCWLIGQKLAKEGLIKEFLTKKDKKEEEEEEVSEEKKIEEESEE